MPRPRPQAPPLLGARGLRSPNGEFGNFLPEEALAAAPGGAPLRGLGDGKPCVTPVPAAGRPGSTDPSATQAARTRGAFI